MKKYYTYYLALTAQLLITTSVHSAGEKAIAPNCSELSKGVDKHQEEVSSIKGPQGKSFLSLLQRHDNLAAELVIYENLKKINKQLRNSVKSQNALSKQKSDKKLAPSKIKQTITSVHRTSENIVKHRVLNTFLSSLKDFNPTGSIKENEAAFTQRLGQSCALTRGADTRYCSEFKKALHEGQDSVLTELVQGFSKVYLTAQTDFEKKKWKSGPISPELFQDVLNHKVSQKDLDSSDSESFKRNGVDWWDGRKLEGLFEEARSSCVDEDLTVCSEKFIKENPDALKKVSALSDINLAEIKKKKDKQAKKFSQSRIKELDKLLQDNNRELNAIKLSKEYKEKKLYRDNANQVYFNQCDLKSDDSSPKIDSSPPEEVCSTQAASHKGKITEFEDKLVASNSAEKRKKDRLAIRKQCRKDEKKLSKEKFIERHRYNCQFNERLIREQTQKTAKAAKAARDQKRRKLASKKTFFYDTQGRNSSAYRPKSNGEIIARAGAASLSDGAIWYTRTIIPLQNQTRIANLSPLFYHVPPARNPFANFISDADFNSLVDFQTSQANFAFQTGITDTRILTNLSTLNPTGGISGFGNAGFNFTQR